MHRWRQQFGSKTIDFGKISEANAGKRWWGPEDIWTGHQTHGSRRWNIGPTRFRKRSITGKQKRKADVNDLDGRDEAELEKARKHMTHVAVGLQTKFSAIDVASLLIGAGIGTMLANFGRDIAIEYFRQVVDDLNALPQPGDAPRVN